MFVGRSSQALWLTAPDQMTSHAASKVGMNQQHMISQNHGTAHEIAQFYMKRRQAEI